MNTAVKDTELLDKIFEVKNQNFIETALQVFQFQYQHNKVYQTFCNALNTDPQKVQSLQQIPFLPINFFKTHKVVCGNFEPEVVFESSGTTQSINSTHFVKSISLYQQSFLKCFPLFYGPITEYCILALLPSYLERKNASLVMMTDELIQQSKHPLSGFYLNELDQLQNILLQLENSKQKTLLIGVTFALIDFSKNHPMELKHTTVMETGGMKGRKKEMTRSQVHEILGASFKQNDIHSEYGMTELLSQAYSTGKGIFNTPPWMKILLREVDDPISIMDKPDTGSLRGVINVIDLANLYSCSFIATDDAGKLYGDGSFEVMGRVDHSDIRGCSLMTL